jgi:membrane associated rhomboid family serine protease
MGLYDRDYYREEEPRGIRLAANWSAVTTLIAVNVAIAVCGMFMPIDRHTKQNWLTEHLGLQPDLFHNPWNFWQLLTYGFLHDPLNILHLASNMLGLFVFGRDVETVYGRREFYRLYISLVIMSGLFYEVVQIVSPSNHPVIGASGAVMGVAVLFACHFPRRKLYVIPFPFPIPAAVLVSLYAIYEFWATQDQGSLVAHWVHVGGIAFGFLYYKTGWSLFRLWPSRWNVGAIRLPRRGPKLRVHQEIEDDEPPPDDYLTTGRLQKRVDQLLEKISTSGEGSLTDEERQFLAEASRRYQQQRRR